MAIKIAPVHPVERPSPRQPVVRKPGRPKGSGSGASKDALVPVTLRLHPDLVGQLKALGPGWRAHAADILAKKLNSSGYGSA